MIQDRLNTQLVLDGCNIDLALICFIQFIEFNTIFCTETSILSMFYCQAAKLVQGKQAVFCHNFFLEPEKRGWSGLQTLRKQGCRRRQRKRSCWQWQRKKGCRRWQSRQSCQLWRIKQEWRWQGVLLWCSSSSIVEVYLSFGSCGS